MCRHRFWDSFHHQNEMTRTLDISNYFCSYHFVDIGSDDGTKLKTFASVEWQAKSIYTFQCAINGIPNVIAEHLSFQLMSSLMFANVFKGILLVARIFIFVVLEISLSFFCVRFSEREIETGEGRANFALKRVEVDLIFCQRLHVCTVHELYLETQSVSLRFTVWFLTTGKLLMAHWIVHAHKIFEKNMI